MYFKGVSSLASLNLFWLSFKGISLDETKCESEISRRNYKYLIGHSDTQKAAVSREVTANFTATK